MLSRSGRRDLDDGEAFAKHLACSASVVVGKSRLNGFKRIHLRCRATHGHLTMTGLYNALERLRELEAGAPVDPLTPAERDTHDAGQISVLKDLHDRIDRAVLDAYGWDDLAPALDCQTDL